MQKKRSTTYTFTEKEIREILVSLIQSDMCPLVEITEANCQTIMGTMSNGGKGLSSLSYTGYLKDITLTIEGVKL